VLSDDASDRDELRSLLHRYTGDPRIRWIENTSRSGIAVNTNRGIREAQGEYIAFLDHDDELAPDALYHIALRLQDRKYGLLYSDEDRIEEDEFGHCVHHSPYFKPDFDSDLLLSLNYICHLVVVNREILNAVDGLRPGYEGAQDHDLLLRVVENLREEEVLHLPRVLYHWRVTPGSVSRTPQWADTIQQNIVAVVDDHLRRRQSAAKAEPHNDPLGSGRQFATRVRWSLPQSAPDISIVIATRDRLELLRPCIQSVLANLEQYPGRTEILIVDNDTTDPSTLRYFSQISALPHVRIVRFRGQFNYSSINNAGARQAAGDVLIFLNNDTVVLSKDWCVELVANAMRPEVGAVGARLLYPDGTIQHAGVILGIEGVAGHECVGETPMAGGYFGRTQLQRSTAAVTGACLVTRKELFLKMDGGFDELDLKVAFNDVDYCMKLRKAGYRVIYNPFAVLYHLESKSRGREITQAQQERHRLEALAFRARWSDEEILDPYYNLHFERYARPFERLRPPPEIDRSMTSTP
jgi:GT2 family glycosyltransferase